MLRYTGLFFYLLFSILLFYFVYSWYLRLLFKKETRESGIFKKKRTMIGLNYFFISLFIIRSFADQIPLTLFSLDKYPNAKCLDGSAAGYYYQPASDKIYNDKTIIYLNGGGECDNENDCKYQTGTKLGSSKYFTDVIDTGTWMYFADDDCHNNPDFCKWNHIFDPYCSQDLHSGQQTSPNEWNLYFSGHHVLDSILNDLDHVLSNSTEIIVTGASAGGLGLWMNVDWIAKRYPNARVTGAGVASLYFYATFYQGRDAVPPAMADFRQEGVKNMYKLYDAFVDEDCVAAKSLTSSEYSCMFLNNSLPYIDTDIFVIQSQTDQVVLEGHDGFPGEDYLNKTPEKYFVRDWHFNMSNALQPFINQEITNINKNERDLGVFAAACYTHTDFTPSYPLIEQMNFMQSFHNFYYASDEGHASDSYLLIDDCGEVCNPTCN